MDRVWACLLCSQAATSTAPEARDVEVESSFASEEGSRRSEVTAAEAGADADADALLSEGFDIWEQLIGGSCSTSSSALAENAIPSPSAPQSTPLRSTDAALRVDEAFRAAHSMQHHATGNTLSPHRISGTTTGVILQQLLHFVQLVQQCSSSTALQLSPLPLGNFAMQHHEDELNRLARICSRNKQANMAYAGIGKPRAHKQTLIAVDANAHSLVRNVEHATQPRLGPLLQPAKAGVRDWRPAGAPFA